MAEGKANKSGFTAALKVNGKSIPLNPYVESVFANVIAGLVRTLKDTPEPETVEFTLRKG
jgi:molybdopterin-guanine dinucleotide biosynthesis adapter protein